MAEPYLDPVFLKLFAYQRPHVEALGRSLESHNCINDGSDTGTGKTYSTCALAKWKGRRLFIICPKPVVEAWFLVAAEYEVEILGISNYESIKNGKYYETLEMYRRDIRVDCPYVVVTKDDKDVNFEWELPDDCLVCIDEAHRGKNAVTVNSKLLESLKGVISHHPREVGPKVLLLSATLTDKVECFRVFAYLVGLSQYGKHAYRVWLKSLARSHPGCSQIEAIHHVLYPRYGNRISIRDLKASQDEFVRGLFKNNDVLAETYPISPEAEQEITNAYQEIDEAILALKNKQRGENCPLTIILRARQRIELLKAPTISLLAMEYLLNEKHVAIFVNFNETIDQLFQILDEFVQKEFPGKFIAFIRGGQTSEDRAYNIRAFQDGRALCIICNIVAGGTGLSLHGEERVALISPTWSGVALKQVLGRCYRSTGGDVIQRIIYCRGKTSPAGPEANQNDTTFASERGRVGVEELICESVNKKLRTIEFLNEGDVADLVQI